MKGADMFKKYLFIIVCISLARGQEPGTGTAINRADEYSGKIVLVDKNCIDGEYILGPKESFFEPNDFPSIQDLVDSYNSNNYMAFIYGVLERRYPTGKSIIEQAGGQSAVDKWLWNTGSATSVLSQLGLVVHEIGHGIDQTNPENWYFISLDPNGNPLSFTTPGMHGEITTSSSPMYSIERSLTLDDDQNWKRPPAQSSEITTSNEWGDGPFGCDENYAETYLNGDPYNSTFEGGDQGYNMLIEEVVQYINSIACAYYFQDYYRASSDRHAMYTWLWWNERYLRKIRTENTDQYEYLFNNTKWLELILTLWGRAWLYLSTDFPGMQPDSDYLHELIQQEETLSEIQRIRDACGCDDPVELLPDQTVISGETINNAHVKTLSHYNYPNPFINKTRISFITNQKQNVRIDIYNSKGCMIHTLCNGQLEKGTYAFAWDGRNSNGANSSNGIYFYRITTNGLHYKGKIIKQGSGK